MGNRYLVVSDLHLCDVEDHADGWKRYKSAAFVFDGQIAALVETFRTAGDGEPTLVLNGDIFDFDLVAAVPDDPPFPVSRAERWRGLDATAEKSVWKLERVLAHHPRFVATLAQFAAHGHRIVYVLGNHDRELHFPEVRAALERAVRAAAGLEGAEPARPLIQIEEWFYYVSGELYAEHGQQYDYYSSFRHLLAPVVEVRGQRTLLHSTRKRMVGGFYAWDHRSEVQELGLLCSGTSDEQGRLRCTAKVKSPSSNWSKRCAERQRMSRGWRVSPFFA